MKRPFSVISGICLGMLTLPAVALAGDQTVPGAGNAAADQTSTSSPLIRSSEDAIVREAEKLKSDKIRNEVLDMVANKDVCVKFRASLLIRFFRLERRACPILGEGFQDLRGVVREVHDHHILLAVMTAVQS